MLILFKLECLFPLFAQDTFLGVLDTSGKLNVYWSNQSWDKPAKERYLQPWKETYVFLMPDSVFTLDDLKFRFERYLPIRLYDNPLVAHLNILEGYYQGRVLRKGPWGDVIILPSMKSSCH
jgi:hypothetical protein